MPVNAQEETQPTAKTVGYSPKLIASTIAALVTPFITTRLGLDDGLVEDLLTTLITGLVVALSAYFASPGDVVVDSPGTDPALDTTSGGTDLAMGDPTVRELVGDPKDPNA